MKNKAIKSNSLLGVLFAVGMLFASGETVYGQEKSILWMHGLNGELGGAKLQQYHNKIPETYKVKRSYSHYSGVRTSHAGVDNVADDIYYQANWRFGSSDKLIYVGHSMGGLIGKELDIRNSRGERNGMKFDGIITLGSPLSGAKAANSLESPFPYYAWWNAGWGSPVNNLISEVYKYLYSSFDPISRLIVKFVVARKNFNLDDLLDGSFPMEGQTWQDLKKGSQGYAYRRNIYTSTPKIHIWGNIKRPIFETMAETYNFAGSYRTILNVTHNSAEVYAWLPGWGTYQASRSMQANAYFKYTLNGRYANLISDGVRYSRKYRLMRTWKETKECYKNTVKRSAYRCGWWSWLCYPFVFFAEVWVCTARLIWANTYYFYDEPHYPDTDGVVSKYSATAQGQRWGSDVHVEVKDTEHNQLTEYKDESKKEFHAIFDGNQSEVPDNLKEIFKFSRIKKPTPYTPAPYYPTPPQDEREAEQVRRNQRHSGRQNKNRRVVEPW